MKKNKRKLVLSLLALAFVTTGIIEGTYAYFSNTGQAPTQIKMAKVDIGLSIDEGSLKTYSMGVEQESGSFENGGRASFQSITVSGENQRCLILGSLTPGDSLSFSLGIENRSNIAILYRIALRLNSEDACPLQLTGAKDWSKVDALGEIEDEQIEIAFPVESGNEYQNREYEILIRAEAVQANAFSNLP